MISRIGIALAAAFLVAPVLAAEAPRDTGPSLFAEHCAICHGETARGDGPLADLLKVAPPDLTTLAARNGGSFPEERVYRTIDGRAELRAHGTRAMPVWGSAFRAQAIESADPSRGPTEPENVVTARILALVRYLESLQQ